MEGLLTNLILQRTLPEAIIVVDSSQSRATQEVVQAFHAELRSLVTYVRSKPAAPHQKNIGLRYARDVLRCEFVFFLDDDVRPNPDYFERSLEIFDRNPSVACLGGVDEEIAFGSRFLERLGIKRGFRVTRGGYFKYAVNPESLETSDWVPGGMQSMRLSSIGLAEFMDDWRLYGDEVEFQTRVFLPGQIATSRQLRCRHLASRGAKESRANEAENYIHFRWWFVSQLRSSTAPIFFWVSTLSLVVIRLPFVFARGDLGATVSGEIRAMKKILSGQSEIAVVERENEELIFKTFDRS